MKANELRIGNYVKSPNMNAFFRVDEILIDENIGYISTMYPMLFIDEYNGFSCMLRANICDITPIPLTEDILLKCGFKFEKEKEELFGIYVIEFEVEGYYFKVDTLCLSCKDKTLSSFFYKDRIQIKYLHQLQNLYFALAGKELEVKLS